MEEVSGVTSIMIFISGAVLLIYSAEKLIGYLIGAASGLRVSVFLLAIIFTGIEFDDVFLGVVLNLEELSGVALGIVFGTALSITGVVFALAAILTPTPVSIPRDYILILAASPLVMIFFTLTAPFTALDGVILLGLFVAFIVYVAVREYGADKPVFRDPTMYEGLTESGAGDGGRAFSERMPFAEVRRLPGWAGLGLSVLALAGLIIGAATTGIGTEGILESYDIQGTVFGATIITAVLTIEDIFLTVEPIRKGAPEIGIGNVIGSVVFSVTGKLGVILLAGGSIVVGSAVLVWHLPALVALTAFAAYVIYTGQLKPWQGFTLIGLYAVYWIVSFVVFGTVPVEAD